MLDKLEKLFHGKAIHNLMLYMIGGYIIGYMLQFGSRITNVDFISYITLEPAYVIHKFQIWRVLTWIIIPPTTSIFWAFFMFLFLYYIGASLENVWGAFRFNAYIFGGILFTIIGAFVEYGIFALAGHNAVGIGNFISTYYIYLSIFLAASASFPDMEVRLYFLIPIKIKWMGILYGVILGYEIISNITRGMWYISVPIICSLLNFLIFFLSTRNYRNISPKEIHRRNEFKRNATPPRTHMRDGSPISRHKCAVCGRTELTNPELEFRFCSKCKGNYEYCSEHLFTHQHVL